MTQGVVKSTEDGIGHITTMQNTIKGGLTEAISALVSAGDQLNIENFAGGSADQFYTEWPDTKRALQTAIERLDMMSNDIMTVNTNVQTAGGN